MGRSYINLNKDNETIVKSSLKTLIADGVTPSAYRRAFYNLGSQLGKLLKEKLVNNSRVLLVCASEDADWLARGVMEAIPYNPLLAVFWSKRITVCTNPKLEVSPIVKSYIDKDAASCDTMIIVKSIISTSCVVKTQLNYLIDRVNPRQIIIAAPVMYKDAPFCLNNEFPETISSRFSFVSFAIDDEREDKTGVVIPGVGGMVYDKLGLGGIINKNSYMPEVVRERAFKKNIVHKVQTTQQGMFVEA